MPCPSPQYLSKKIESVSEDWHRSASYLVNITYIVHILRLRGIFATVRYICP